MVTPVAVLFHAEEVHVPPADDDDEIYVVAFGVSPQTAPPEGLCLQIQRDEDEEVRDGPQTLTGPCLVLDPGQRCHYQGVTDVRVGPGSVLIGLTAEAARTLEVPDDFAITYDPRTVDEETLRAGLARALAPLPIG
ncbi:hypothetical protein SAMN04489712_102462 [Thermomonospora echinospora]|uniref:Immunity protein 10 n=1 Tax=Thermomonospora echinospora TaxID=1992 RepID=A0A1H5VW56_9ACTN|nr:hypothetical protein [Thermomonospora echinospora]SEF90817.1 hypothetical protein SAMN04489712_102462 [Thermomonospora echinospora]